MTLEAGCQHTDAAADTDERQARAFLAVTGALDAPAPAADPSFYRMDTPVEKPPAESYSLHVENFEPFSKGAVYASTPIEELVAERPFVPILMSECGYDTIFGYKESLLGETLSEAMDELLTLSSASETPADRSE